MALFSILIMPLNAFPWVINGLIEAYVSIKRIQEFLRLPELQLDKYYGRWKGMFYFVPQVMKILGNNTVK